VLAINTVTTPIRLLCQTNKQTKKHQQQMIENTTNQTNNYNKMMQIITKTQKKYTTNSLANFTHNGVSAFQKSKLQSKQIFSK